MKLFMVLSGLALYISKKNSVYVKFKRLVISTFIWSIILWTVHDFEFVGIKWYRDFDIGFFDYMILLLKNPAWIIWFFLSKKLINML